jgi:predicted regulator of Ras-like GTPase activity (Roadblock/LC7/MglB family)
MLHGLMLGDTLKKIVDNTPGAAGAILMGFDGIAVMQYQSEAAPLVDIESSTMEFSFRFIELRNAARALDMGPVSDITVKGEKMTILCRVLTDEYFVALVLTDPRHFGKGRWMLRSNASELQAEL